MKVQTTEISQLTYKQLQAVVKEMKSLMSCYRDVKLSVKREVLEQIIIEASTRNGQGYRDVAQAANATSLTDEEKYQIAKASRQVYTLSISESGTKATAKTETLDYPVVTATAEELEALEVAYQAPESDWIEPKTEPAKDFTNADAVYYTVVIPNNSNLSECDVFNRSEGNVEHRVNYNRDCRRGVFAAACTLRSTPVAEDIENAEEAYSVSYSLNYRYEAVRCTRYEMAEWIKADSQAGVKTGNGHAQVWGFACSLANKPKVEVEPYTEAMAAEDDELTAGVVVDEGSQYDGVDILAVNYVYIYDTHNDVKEENWVTHGCKVGIHTYNRYGEAYNAPACSLVYCDATNRAFGHDPEAVAEVRVVGGYSYNDGFIRRTATVTATMLTCDVCNYQQCELPQPYIHTELGLVNGSSLTTISYDLDTDEYYVDAEGVVRTLDGDVEVVFEPSGCNDLIHEPCHKEVGVSRPAFAVRSQAKPGAWLEIRPNGRPYCATCDQLMASCQCGHPTIQWTEEPQSFAHKESWNINSTEDYEFTVTPSVKSAFEDTTAHYSVTRKEPLLVAAVNNLYGFLTSKLVTNTLRSAWFWSYASLCVLWAMVQLTYQVTATAFKLATSPQAIALYNTVLTATLLALCNVLDYADSRWQLLSSFLDSALDLVLGLLPRKPQVLTMDYFLD